MKVALANDHRWINPENPNWYARQILAEDQFVTDALHALNVASTRVDWADTSVDWQQYDAVLIRQTWDYFDRFVEFQNWIDRIDATTTLINPAAVVRWNWDKQYLLDLSRAGVPTVQTKVVKRQEQGPDLATAMQQTGLSQAVIKPAVSGAGRETYRIRSLEDARQFQTRWQQLVAAEDMLIQPFMPEILNSGEASIMIMHGQVTHAVRKIAAPGEFRVQDDHGGKVVQHVPSAAEKNVALQAIEAVPAPVSYARVDLVVGESGPCIMELELIEPECFFRNCPQAAQQLAASVVEVLRPQA